MESTNQEYFNALNQLREAQASLQSRWIIETVKHLAIINIAGLAGSSALLKIAEIALTPVKVSLVLFFLGLVLTVVDFHLNSLAFLAQVNETDRARIAFRAAETAGEVSRHGIPKSSAGQSLFKAAGTVGWISALLALSGGSLIAYAVLCG
ncbi:hypothetical protein D7I39_10810 [Allopusillimonas ginsengisoli]|nr:hypothetical protein D7I39_10810 [Allopusillimonas ginsengisoli]